MKKSFFKIVFIALGFVFTNANTIFAQYTLIPDPNFETALAIYDDISGDGKIPNVAINSVSSLDVSNKNINDLTGIKGFINLKSLDCIKNNLTSLDVSGIVGLERLRCSINQINDLKVTGLAQLLEIYCLNNRLTTLNLSGLSNLTTLNCDYNQITDLSISGLTNLTDVSFNSNFISTINLTGSSKIASIVCDNNLFTIFDVSTLKDLSSFSCSLNKLTSLNLKGLTKLSYFVSSSNPTLNCIEVDNVAIAQSKPNWTKDNATIYSIDCGVCTPKTVNINQESCISFSWNGKTLNTSGVYKDTLIASNGCDSIITLNLTINQLPIITQNPTSVVVCREDNVILEVKTNNITDAVRWEWQSIDNAFPGTLLLENQFGAIGYNASILKMNEVSKNGWLQFKLRAKVTSAKGCINYSTGADILPAPQSFYTLDTTICGGNTFSWQGKNITSDGSYSDTLGNAAGCDSILVLNILFKSLPSSAISVNSATVTAQEIESEYQWINCANNLAMPNERNKSLIVTKTGDYAVKITKDRCSVTSVCEKVIITSLESEAEILNNTFIYPIPSSGRFTIDLSHDAKVHVMNALGEEIMSQNMSAGQNQINLENNAEGIYLIQIRSDFGQTTKSVVISR